MRAAEHKLVDDAVRPDRPGDRDHCHVGWHPRDEIAAVEVFQLLDARAPGHDWHVIHGCIGRHRSARFGGVLVAKLGVEMLGPNLQHLVLGR